MCKQTEARNIDIKPWNDIVQYYLGTSPFGFYHARHLDTSNNSRHSVNLRNDDATNTN